jgi:hypothetical protein
VSEILESLIVHGLSSLRWADGNTGDLGPDARPLLGVRERVPARFDGLPRGLRVFERAGGLAFSFEEAAIVAGAPSEAALDAPALAAFEVAGVAGGKDASGRWSAFVPRRFKLELVRRAQLSVPLYRTPASTPRHGGDATLIASCRAPDGRVVPWALFTLSVTVPPGGPREFRAQADQHGDVMIAPQRLPPLPAGVAAYAATLRVAAGAALEPGAEPEPVNPDELAPARMRPLDSAGAAQESLSFSITPGIVRRLVSAGQPAPATALILEP